jgi:hypothetical protein
VAVQTSVYALPERERIFPFELVEAFLPAFLGDLLAPFRRRDFPSLVIAQTLDLRLGSMDAPNPLRHGRSAPTQKQHPTEQERFHGFALV